MLQSLILMSVSARFGIEERIASPYSSHKNLQDGPLLFRSNSICPVSLEGC